MKLAFSKRGSSNVAFLLVMALAPAPGLAAVQEKGRLVFQGGSRGNNFEIIWAWLTEHLKKDSGWEGILEVIPSDGVGGLDALAAGKADFTLVKAPATARMAYEGKGLFNAPHRALRSFGLLPVPDWLTFAVRPDIQADTVEELLRQKRPLRIATGRDSPRDVVTFLLGEILGFHGTTFEELERAGGRILRLDPGDSIQAGIDGKVDVIFQEAQSMALWDGLFAKGWKVLSLNDAARETSLADLSHPA
ncbi:MAG: hypothetical protein HY652_00300 [Acidobacteria bacterium]|nr:hypothetical protein [Acidobacteriota bacterium]